MSIDELGIHLGPLYIRFYALALMTGMITAAALTARRAKQYGYDPDHVWNGLTWVILAGIVGARLYHVLTPPPSMGITAWDYLKDPLKVIDLPSGGLGVPGGLIGGALAVYIYARRNKQSFLVWADLTIPGVALAQAIGRWGNFVNQELYGQPTDLPWGIFIKPYNRLPGYGRYEHFHPMFFYEMIWNLLICAVLIWVHRRFTDRLRSGDLLGLYMILYPGGRFFLEFIKLDAPALGQGLTIAQVVSLVTMAVGAAFIFIRQRVAARQSALVRPAKMNRQTLVLLDIDGTLLWPNGAGALAMRRALTEVYDTAGALEQIYMAGMTDRSIIQGALAGAQLSPDEIEALWKPFTLAMERHLVETVVERGVQVCPGALELLDALNAREDVLLGLVTGNLANTAPIKLRAAGIDPGLFHVGGYGSDDGNRDKLPAIAAERAQALTGQRFAGSEIVVVGDTPADVACGKVVGARTVAVATGALPTEALHAAQPDVLLPDFTDLGRTLDAILPTRRPDPK